MYGVMNVMLEKCGFREYQKTRRSLITRKTRIISRGWRFGSTGFVLLELLLAMLIIQVGMLGIAQLFLGGARASFDLERSVMALELLRGEIEKVEKENFDAIFPVKRKNLATGITYTLNVTNCDNNKDYIVDYKYLDGWIYWQDATGKERCYQLVTYRRKSQEFGMAGTRIYLAGSSDRRKSFSSLVYRVSGVFRR